MISEELRTAIRELFSDESVAYGLLGQGLSPAERNSDYETNLDPMFRIPLLSSRLESYIVQLSKELDELGPGELPRLRSEATAFLIVLREIRTFFPEAFGSGPSAGGSD